MYMYLRYTYSNYICIHMIYIVISNVTQLRAPHYHVFVWATKDRILSLSYP